MSHAVSSGQEDSSWLLWSRLLAGPIIWAVHFVLGHLLIDAYCSTGLHFNVLRVEGFSFVFVVITVLAVFGCGYLGLQSYHGWGGMNNGMNFKQQFKELKHWSDEVAEFMYFTGFLLSALFTINILTVSLPVFFLRTCT